MPEEVEKKLRREARKRKIKDKEAYIYGTLRKLGWKPKKKNKKGKKRKRRQVTHLYQNSKNNNEALVLRYHPLVCLLNRESS